MRNHYLILSATILLIFISCKKDMYDASATEPIETKTETQSVKPFEAKDTLKTLKEIKLALLDATQEKVELMFGQPNDYNKGFWGHITKGYSVYYNAVKGEDGKVKNLVLFLRKNPYGYSVKTTRVEEIYAVENGGQACFGIHCITVNHN